MPTISVIVPVYKVEPYLHRCVDSILAQTFSDFELILVDDGSPDRCGEICDEYAAKDERVCVIHKENGGAANARNCGLDKAVGDFIMFVDADDYLEHDMCQRLYNAILRYEAECIAIGYTIVDKDGRQEQVVAVSEPIIADGLGMLRERYLKENPAAHTVEPWGKLFRRTMWQDVSFTEGMYYEDMDVMPRLYCCCRKMVVIPGVGYYYFLRGDSASHSGGTDHKRVTDSVLIRQKHMKFYDRIGEKELAANIAGKLSDLVITADCNGWIPVEEADNCKAAFREAVYMIGKCGKINMKARIRYGVYHLFGAGVYKRIFNR